MLRSFVLGGGLERLETCFLWFLAGVMAAALLGQFVHGMELYREAASVVVSVAAVLGAAGLLRSWAAGSPWVRGGVRGGTLVDLGMLVLGLGSLGALWAGGAAWVLAALCMVMAGWGLALASVFFVRRAGGELGAHS